MLSLLCSYYSVYIYDLRLICWTGTKKENKTQMWVTAAVHRVSKLSKSTDHNPQAAEAAEVAI